MNTHAYLIAFMAVVVMVAAGTPDVKKDAGLNKKWFGGSKEHPADMSLPDLMDSLHEHLVALKDSIHVVEGLQNIGIDSTIEDLLSKLNGVPIIDTTLSHGYPSTQVYSTTPPPPTTTDSWLWGTTDSTRSIDIRRKRLNELLVKKFRAIIKEEQ